MVDCNPPVSGCVELDYYDEDGKYMNPWLVVLLIIVGLFLAMYVIAMIKRPESRYQDKPEEQNPMQGKMVRFVEDETEPANADGMCGHLEAIGETDYKASFFERVVKRCFDIILSFGGLVVLSPVFLWLFVWIKVDDPGPVLFTQKRVGQDKRYFTLHKFRSMKMSTPHDKPTHMLDNPDQYITKSGRFIRAHSLDELPQIWDIFIGNMSVIGKTLILGGTRKISDFSRVCGC